MIDPPEVALAAFDKAAMHPRLVAAGFTVPATIIVPRAATDGFQLGDSDRARLGTPFVIKPARGYGRHGVIFDATEPADLAQSVAAWPDEAYLLQRRVAPRLIGGEPAYFRVYFVFGTIWCCWWNCFTDRYRSLSPEEEKTLELAPLRTIVAGVAALTGMQFFSSEIALTEAGEFVLIDYVNDQCHMLAQSADPRIGVPNELVAAVARRLVEGAASLIGQAKGSP